MELKAKKQEDDVLPFPQGLAERTLRCMKLFRRNMPVDHPGLSIERSFYPVQTSGRVVYNRCNLCACNIRVSSYLVQMNISLRVLLILVFSCGCSKIFAQAKKGTFINKKELIGTWQKDFYRVGNGLNQNFKFFSDGRFIFSNGKYGDDAVSTIKLMGRYRLVKDSLFFTIASKTIIEGELEMVDPGIDLGIFQYGPKSTVKEVKESHPKEMAEPCFLTYLKRGKIKLSNGMYYKVIAKDNER
jgi:hypothetical protein